jgi:hypothetical protein
MENNSSNSLENALVANVLVILVVVVVMFRFRSFSIYKKNNKRLSQSMDQYALQLGDNRERERKGVYISTRKRQAV